MSTTAAPFGLRPVGKLDQGALEPFRQLPIASGYGTAIAAGDLVQLVTNTNATTIEKQSGTGSTTADIDIAGIFMGCTYTDPNLNYVIHSSQWPASTVASDAMAYVCIDPNVLFEIQADGAIANDNAEVFGANFLLVQTAPNTTLGISRVALDIDTLTTDANAPIKVVDYKGGFQGDEVGTDYPILVAKFNYHQFSTATGAS